MVKIKCRATGCKYHSEINDDCNNKEIIVSSKCKCITWDRPRK